ncbi:MAG: hypothetical protein JRI25_04500 [Deltaproteobacteria bacterium]|nr:hypothetical protein [Deltaproteobacteria bacterium]
MGKRGDTAIIDRLNERERGHIEFYLATDAVVAGGKLEPVSGGSVSVSQVGTFEPELEDLVVGRTIDVGHLESLEGGDLQCYQKGSDVLVALFREGRPVSRVLKCRAEAPLPEGGVDEGLFTWFGPVEYVGTPWSDNDDFQCQVVTVDRLRAYRP